MDASEPGSAKPSISTEVQDGESSAPVILQILPMLETGGVERGTVDITAAIAKAGGIPLVVSGGGPMVREVERAGGEHISLPVHSKNPLVMRSNARALEALIRGRRIDIVHARSRAPAWCARKASARAGASFMTTFHGAYGESNHLKHIYNSVMAKGERVIAISQFIADRIQSLYQAGPDRVRIIPRGIDFTIFNPMAVSPERMIQLSNDWRLTDGIPVILLPGRLTRWKGHEILIEALARLGRRDLRCVLVGDEQGRSGYRRDLDAHVARAGLADIVQIVGDCRDMAAAYMVADVVVSASTDPEAFGRVAAEAQAMGRPVIATDHGAVRETVLADGVTGWLVPPGEPDALAVALEQALALTTSEREAMAERSMAHVHENFDKNAMCAKTMVVYNELMAGRHGDGQTAG